LVLRLLLQGQGSLLLLLLLFVSPGAERQAREC
jgi:hypothetical protein